MREAMQVYARYRVQHVDVDGAVLADYEGENQVTDTGRAQYHKQCFDTSGLGANGNNYIGLTNNGTAPAHGDTALTAELSGNGLTRAQGTVTLATGTGTVTTITYTFTYSGTSQAVQKAALFNASSSGVMNHEILFTQVTLTTGQGIIVTFQITLA